MLLLMLTLILILILILLLLLLLSIAILSDPDLQKAACDLQMNEKKMNDALALMEKLVDLNKRTALMAQDGQGLDNR